MEVMISSESAVVGCVSLPASKSLSNRALIINALGGGSGAITNVARCDDTDVMVSALTQLPATIDIGAAGTAMRFLTAYLATTPGEWLLTGSRRMCHRPIALLVDALRSLGATIAYAGEEGYPPLRITGGALGCQDVLEIAGSVSSQYISALLMIAPTLAGGLTLRLTGEVVSETYITLTIKMMRDFGAEVVYDRAAQTIRVAGTGYRPTDYAVESDWAAASYWLEIEALAGERRCDLTLLGLNADSLQADARVREIMSAVVSRPARLEVDMRLCPDMAQTVVCSCCGLGVPFHITGLQTLKIKETDRIVALQTELRKLGFVITSRADSELLWSGERCEASMAPIDTYDDHRMAMAFAPLALVFGKISINNPEVVSKSYPDYWEHLEQCGFSLSR